MLRKGLKWLLVAWLGMTASSVADTQFGVYGLQGQTNHDDLPNPAGFGGFIEKSLSHRSALRLSYSWAVDQDRYSATFYRINNYFEVDTLSDLWEQHSSISVAELSFLVAPLVTEPLSLRIGFSLGNARFHQDIVGRSLGQFDEPRTTNRFIVGVLADVDIAYRETRPFVIHLTIHERSTLGGSVQTMQDYWHYRSPYSSFKSKSISNAEMAIALALKL